MWRLALGLAILSFLGPLACSTTDDGGLDAGLDTDGGPPVVWQKVAVPSTEDFLGIWGRSRRDPETMLESQLDIFVVGFGGTILHYDGTTWTQETTTSTLPLTAVSGTGLPDPSDPRADPALTYAVGWQGTILERTPAGNWTTVTTTATEDLFDIAMGGDDNGLIVGDSGRVLVYDGQGTPSTNAWRINRFAIRGEFSNQLIDPKTSLKGVWTQNGGRYYLVGAGGAAFRSTNGPRNYEGLDTRISDPLVGVWGSGNDSVYAVGLDSLLMRWDGGQWRRVDLEGLPRVFLMDADGQGGDFTIVGWRGVVLRRTPEGFISEGTDVSTDFRGVWIDPITDVAWAVGASGLVMRRDPPPPEDAGVP